MACDAPISIKYKHPLPDGKGGFIWWFPADCGKCLKCLMKRKAQWSFRMVEEQRNSFSSYFVTLTYNDEYVPYGDSGHTINKNDHFNFIKELKRLETPKLMDKRKQISNEELKRIKTRTREFGKLKYYGVSEYGDRTYRPHWHYILFNVRDIGNINNAWPYGIVQVDECNVNTIDYVLKYMLKEQKDAKADGRQVEVSFMSKGLGLSVADESFINYINEPRGNQVVNSRGSKIPLPRYYRKKLLSEEVRIVKNQYIAEEMAKQEQKQDQEWIDRGYNPYQKRREAKEVRNHLLKIRKKRNHE